MQVWMKIGLQTETWKNHMFLHYCQDSIKSQFVQVLKLAIEWAAGLQAKPIVPLFCSCFPLYINLEVSQIWITSLFWPIFQGFSWILQLPAHQTGHHWSWRTHIRKKRWLWTCRSGTRVIQELMEGGGTLLGVTCQQNICPCVRPVPSHQNEQSGGDGRTTSFSEAPNRTSSGLSASAQEESPE